MCHGIDRRFVDSENSLRRDLFLLILWCVFFSTMAAPVHGRFSTGSQFVTFTLKYDDSSRIISNGINLWELSTNNSRDLMNSNECGDGVVFLERSDFKPARCSWLKTEEGLDSECKCNFFTREFTWKFQNGRFQERAIVPLHERLKNKRFV
jgi:hypothetical protein